MTVQDTCLKCGTRSLIDFNKHFKKCVNCSGYIQKPPRRKRCSWIGEEGKKCNRLAIFHLGWRNYKDIWYCKAHESTGYNLHWQEQERLNQRKKINEVADIIKSSSTPEEAAKRILGFSLYT